MMILSWRKNLQSAGLVLAGILLTGCAGNIKPTSSEARVVAMSQGKSIDKAELAELDAIVEKGIAQKTYPGAVLVVGRGNETLWAKPYGQFTYDEDSPKVTLDTIYDLASVSKVVGTTTMSMGLLSEGKLSVSDPVSKYIPGFDSNGKESVTIRHLMTHISGLKAYESVDVVEKTRTAEESKSDALIRHYAALVPLNPPGTKYVYSCLNFQTMARVNEVASGRRMEDYLKEKIYGPLGMRDATYILTEEQAKRTAPPFRVSEAMPVGRVHDPIARYHGSDEHCPGNAGLFATAPDLARYCRMILNEGTLDGKRVLATEVVRDSTRNHLAPELSELQGLGFDVIERKNLKTDLNDDPENYIIGHTGYTGTLIWMDKKSGAYFVLLTNRTYPTKRGDAPPTEAPAGEVAAIRGEVAQVVLRAMPEYQEYFAAGQ